MNPRRRYRGPGTKAGRVSGRSGLFGVLLALLAGVSRLRTTGFDLIAAIGSFMPTAGPVTVPAPWAMATPPPPAATPADLPTWTPTAPPPSAAPTALLVPRPTQS